MFLIARRALLTHSSCNRPHARQPERKTKMHTPYYNSSWSAQDTQPSYKKSVYGGDHQRRPQPRTNHTVDHSATYTTAKKRRHGRRRSCLSRFLLIVLILSLIIGIGAAAMRMSPLHQADTSLGWNLILVNQNHSVPRDYDVELTTLSNGKKVDSRIYPSLQTMFNDARASGLSLFVREGYRTKNEQEDIMKNRVETYRQKGYSRRESVKMAREYVARPGASEHELGLAVDINTSKSNMQDKVYNWLQNHSWRYGFILRYPSDKTDITGVSNEPWHFRYVGRDAAKTMKENNWCLEEYVEKMK